MKSTPAQDDALIGRVLGDKFRLRSRVGAGASGTVYQADQTALGRTVAVKVLRPELAGDPRLVQRFRDEALAASRLNHPNTVSVIDYGQSDDGLLYIVMEYLRGITLTQLIRAEPEIDDARVVDVVSQVLAGLEEAHHAGVIHADLKSDNIMIERRRGGWDLVKVVDFGIARLMSSEPGEISRRAICGTPEYMAPELIGGAAPTVATDLYAVGVVLYELLTGETPFGGDSVLDVLTRHLRDEPLAPHVKQPGRAINAALEDIALRALAKNPAERFSSALHFRTVLEQALGQPADDTTTCSACGTRSSLRFKFCPECGHSLGGVISDLFVDTATEPHIMLVPVEGTATVLDLQLEPRETLQGLRLFPLPFMGRERDVEVAMRFVEAPGTGIMSIVGGGGSGRGYMVDEICRRAAALEGTLVHRVGPDPSGLRAPFHPLRAMVARLLSLSPACAYDRLSQGLAELGLSRRDLPGIAELFGHRGEPWQLEPEVRRRELMASTMRVMRAVAQRGRLVLVFENVDRYDRPSQNFLAHLVRSRGEHALRLVVTHGPDEAALWPEGAARIELEPFGADELAVVARYLVESGLDGMPTAGELAVETRGSPAHMHHLVHFVAEGGSLERAPETLADLVAERVQALPYPARVVCQAAAVLGDEVSREVLSDALGSRLDGPLDAPLGVLEGRELCFQSDDGATVGFRNRLVREVIYDATPAELRRELHEAAVRALASRITDPLVLGHHHAMAGHHHEAAELLSRAGDDAVHQTDDAGATRLFHRALDAARPLMLAGDDGDSRARFVALSIKLADALRASGQAALARGLLEEARGYSDGHLQLDARLLQALARVGLGEGKVDGAIETLRHAIGMLIQAGDTRLLAEMYLDLSSIHMGRADVSAALAELSEGLDVITLGEGHAATDGPDILWRLLLRLSQLHGIVGQHDKELELAESALVHARRVRSRIGSARVQAVLAGAYERAGDLSVAEQYRDAAVSEMRRLGDRRGTSELLLSGANPWQTLLRIDPASLREARELADEVGWTEGAALATQKLLSDQ